MDEKQADFNMKEGSSYSGQPATIMVKSLTVLDKVVQQDGNTGGSGISLLNGWRNSGSANDCQSAQQFGKTLYHQA